MGRREDDGGSVMLWAMLLKDLNFDTFTCNPYLSMYTLPQKQYSLVAVAS